MTSLLARVKDPITGYYRLDVMTIERGRPVPIPGSTTYYLQLESSSGRLYAKPVGNDLEVAYVAYLNHKRGHLGTSRTKNIAPPSHESYLYFIQGSVTKLIKIGTTNNVKRRYHAEYELSERRPEFKNKIHRGVSGDFYQAGRLAEGYKISEERVMKIHRKTARFVKKHWNEIQNVAEALLGHGNISREEIHWAMKGLNITEQNNIRYAAEQAADAAAWEAKMAAWNREQDAKQAAWETGVAMNITERELFQMIREHGGIEARSRRHRVIRFPAGQTLVLAKTPSDTRWAEAALSTLRRILTPAPAPSPVQNLTLNAEPRVERKRTVRKSDRPKEIQHTRVEAPSTPSPASNFRAPTFEEWQAQTTQVWDEAEVSEREFSYNERRARTLVSYVEQNTPRAGTKHLLLLSQKYVVICPLRGSTQQQISTLERRIDNEFPFCVTYVANGSADAGYFCSPDSPKDVDETTRESFEKLLDWVTTFHFDPYEKSATRCDFPPGARIHITQDRHGYVYGLNVDGL